MALGVAQSGRAPDLESGHGAGSNPATQTYLPELTQKQVRRFWSRVDREGDCWEWRGYVHSGGYGRISFFRRSYEAHRVAYALTKGDPLGQCVCHRCDNPTCVNPAHLFLGTRDDNNQDMVRKDRHARGEKHGAARLTADDVRAIRASTATAVSLAPKYGISDRMVGKIRKREAWTHIE